MVQVTGFVSQVPWSVFLACLCSDLYLFWSPDKCSTIVEMMLSICTMEVGSVASILEIHAASIFRVEMSVVRQCPCCTGRWSDRTMGEGSVVQVSGLIEPFHNGSVGPPNCILWTLTHHTHCDLKVELLSISETSASLPTSTQCKYSREDSVSTGTTTEVRSYCRGFLFQLTVLSAVISRTYWAP
jgi:hypothetical protein